LLGGDLAIDVLDLVDDDPGFVALPGERPVALGNLGDVVRIDEDAFQRRRDGVRADFFENDSVFGRPRDFADSADVRYDQYGSRRHGFQHRVGKTFGEVRRQYEDRRIEKQARLFRAVDVAGKLDASGHAVLGDPGADALGLVAIAGQNQVDIRKTIGDQREPLEKLVQSLLAVEAGEEQDDPPLRRRAGRVDLVQQFTVEHGCQNDNSLRIESDPDQRLPELLGENRVACRTAEREAKHPARDRFGENPLLVFGAPSPEKNECAAKPRQLEQQAKYRFSRNGLGEQARIDMDDVVAVGDDANEESDWIAKHPHQGPKRVGLVRPPSHDKMTGVDVIAQPGSQQIGELDDAAGNGRGSGPDQDPQRGAALGHSVPLSWVAGKDRIEVSEGNPERGTLLRRFARPAARQRSRRRISLQSL
jgi:hypothetical protein